MKEPALCTQTSEKLQIRLFYSTPLQTCYNLRLRRVDLLSPTLASLVPSQLCCPTSPSSSPAANLAILTRLATPATIPPLARGRPQ